MGLPHSSGDFTATKIANDSKFAKIAYYYGEEKGWWHDSSNGGPLLGMSASGTAYTKKAVVMYMLQAENQGHSNWQSICTSGGYLDAGSAQAVVNLLDSTDWENIEVPSSFQMYKIKLGPDIQDGMIWRYAKVGKLKLKKSSANTSITGR